MALARTSVSFDESLSECLKRTYARQCALIDVLQRMELIDDEDLKYLQNRETYWTSVFDGMEAERGQKILGDPTPGGVQARLAMVIDAMMKGDVDRVVEVMKRDKEIRQSASRQQSPTT